VLMNNCSNSKNTFFGVKFLMYDFEKHIFNFEISQKIPSDIVL
jgi:hypothetical protein